MFMYLYAMHLSMVADEEECPIKKAELEKEVLESLEKVLTLKRNFGGKRAFHEKLVAENARKFLKNTDKIVLPALDLMYLWNVYQVASGNSECLPRILDKINKKLKVYPKDGSDMQIYCYLVFMRGCVYVQSKCPMLAMECFLEVLEHDKELKTERHLAPQACFEIGLIYRRMSDYNEAKAWFKKAKRYNNYITDVMINFRIDYASSSMKNEKE
jgi:tetratricopeptide (TPR) repeat protein